MFVPSLKHTNAIEEMPLSNGSAPRQNIAFALLLITVHPPAVRHLWGRHDFWGKPTAPQRPRPNPTSTLLYSCRFTLLSRVLLLLVSITRYGIVCSDGDETQNIPASPRLSCPCALLRTLITA